VREGEEEDVGGRMGWYLDLGRPYARDREVECRAGLHRLLLDTRSVASGLDPPRMSELSRYHVPFRLGGQDHIQ
jgi:hypothetical protein